MAAIDTALVHILPPANTNDTLSSGTSATLTSRLPKHTQKTVHCHETLQCNWLFFLQPAALTEDATATQCRLPQKATGEGPNKSLDDVFTCSVALPASCRPYTSVTTTHRNKSKSQLPTSDIPRFHLSAHGRRHRLLRTPHGMGALLHFDPDGLGFCRASGTVKVNTKFINSLKSIVSHPDWSNSKTSLNAEVAGGPTPTHWSSLYSMGTLY